MEKNLFQRFFAPGPRGKLRWVIFGIIALFLLTALIDVSGFNNPAASAVDKWLTAVPALNEMKVWPKIERSADNSKSLTWKNIKQIDLGEYGFPFRLGLDLQGGTHLVYNADVSKLDLSGRGDAISGVRDVIERRVNAIGVSEPVVQTDQVGDNWRVIVELAGVHDVNQAIKIIGETPLLEFKEENPQAVKLTPEQQKQLTDENAAIKAKAEDVLKQIKNGGDFVALAKQYSDDPGSKDNGGFYAGIKKGVFVPEYEDVIFNKLKPGEIYPELALSQFGYHIIKEEAVKGEGDAREIDTRHILFKIKTPSDLGIEMESEWLDTQLTGKQLKKASIEFDQNSGIPQVALEFNDEGAELFSEITERNVNKLVAIFLDGQPISIPRVNEAITSGKAIISGNFSLKEAKLLTQRLNAGALPVPITLISQTTVGASLGNEAVRKSLVAGLYGLLLVAIFMVLYYRLPGILSVLALLIYTAISLSVFKLIPVTLTLAGIAGFILSIGMAVDANVLIFARMREELIGGRDLNLAIKEGFRRAWTSIRDSNISSLITCAILYWFGSSIIRGFAFTLAVGTLVSMFSAITITRQILLLVGKWRISRWQWLYGVKKKSQ